MKPSNLKYLKNMRLLTYDSENETSMAIGLEDNGNISISVKGIDSADSIDSEITREEWLRIKSFIETEEEIRARDRRNNLPLYKRFFVI
jgi:hypothetical protein